MPWKRKITGGTLAVIGYLLSPLSWWNDLFVNVPLAMVFASGISAFCPRAFGPAMVVGYWLTNVLGLVLLHKGARQMLSEKPGPSWRRELLRGVGISLAYTLLILALLKLGILKPVQGYLG